MATSSSLLSSQLEELEVYYHSNLRLMGNGKGRKKLFPKHKQEFGTDATSTEANLFRAFAHAVCEASCIPRKELFEAWAMACHVHHHFPSATRFADLASGHGLLGWALLVLHLSNDMVLPVVDRTVVCIDIQMPASVEKVSRAMLKKWPELATKFDYVEGRLEGIVPQPSTVLVGVHCCHVLSDHVIQHAIQGLSPLALVPCCHAKKCLTYQQRKDFQKIEQQQQQQQEESPQPPSPNLLDTEDTTLDSDFSRMAITSSTNFTLTDFLDDIRVQRLRSAGFGVQEERIAKHYTPKNRLIIATPPAPAPVAVVSPTTTTYSSNIPCCQAIMATTTTSTSTSTAAISNLPLLKLATPIRLWIPVADTPTARETLHSMAGRAAAEERRMVLEMEQAPTLMLSIIHPPGSFLACSEIQTLLPARAVMEICTYHNQGRPVLLTPTIEGGGNGGGNVNASSSEPDELPTTVTSTNGIETAAATTATATNLGTAPPRQYYAQSFRIRYPGESKHKAKALHRALLERLPTQFPGAAIRYALR